MTEYVVFKKVAERWEESVKVSARSANAAIRDAITGTAEREGEEYAAVPARSWKPVTVKVETKTALKFS